MPNAWIVSLAAAGFLGIGSVHAPLCWSPDGRWIAYTVTTRSSDDPHASGWIFGGDPPGQTTSTTVWQYRLWATRVEDGVSVLLEDSALPITSPGWNPDGTALAFGRLVALPEARWRFEVVVQTGPERQRVLIEREVEDVPEEADGLPALAVSWSPDGRYLAVPQPSPAGLLLLSAEHGGLIRTLEGAYFSAWSPDGSRLAYFRGRDANRAGLCCLELRSGNERSLANVDQPSQPPVWSANGRSLFVLRTKPGGRRSEQIELVRVGVDPPTVESIKDIEQRIPSEQTFLGGSFTLDRNEFHQFYALLVEGRDPAISHHVGRAVQDRFQVLDALTPVGALALSPSGETLALRLGPPGALAPPALYDRERRQLTLLAPDDSARDEWLRQLIESARTLIQSTLEEPAQESLKAERPSLLPLPGELARNDPKARQLRRMAELALDLSQQYDSDRRSNPLVVEAEVFFAALRGDYPNALDALKHLGPLLNDPDQRFRFLGLQAQLQLEHGEVESARATIAYLRKARTHLLGCVESTGFDRFVLTLLPDSQAWPDRLWRYAEQHESSTSTSSEPTDGLRRSRAAPRPEDVDPEAALRMLRRSS